MFSKNVYRTQVFLASGRAVEYKKVTVRILEKCSESSINVKVSAKVVRPFANLLCFIFILGSKLLIKVIKVEQLLAF